MTQLQSPEEQEYTDSEFTTPGPPQLQTPQIPWALDKVEQDRYKTIFRAWVDSRTGVVNGKTAIDVFGQSGLPKDDLAQIWTLADVDDRGTLNLSEFTVAMGLIYRRLNGAEIPDKLPRELEAGHDSDQSTSHQPALQNLESLRLSAVDENGFLKGKAAREDSLKIARASKL
ncbi:hypothetical protein R3P38DRAFT_2878665 [Favolaschia claudopus]|uniref:Uncharacterized protein n=1 Tax=Favolaschia claudopus TaxID=2862362 RepID=A0AAW0D1R7_9AGAR